jgi:hypothetical protein
MKFLALVALFVASCASAVPATSTPETSAPTSSPTAEPTATPVATPEPGEVAIRHVVDAIDELRATVASGGDTTDVLAWAKAETDWLVANHTQLPSAQDSAYQDALISFLQALSDNSTTTPPITDLTVLRNELAALIGAEAAATPEPTPAEAFAPIKLTGRGSRVPKFTIPEDTAAIAIITEKGTSNFVVWTLGADGSKQELLVNDIGSYKGTVLFDVEADTHSVAFKIESNGSWTITIAPISRARTWATSGALTGKGDDVVQLSPPVAGFATTTVSHRGSANFVVHSYSDSGVDLLVNEIGNYKAEIQLPDGTLLLQVEADGAWSFTAPV